MAINLILVIVGVVLLLQVVLIAVTSGQYTNLKEEMSELNYELGRHQRDRE